MIRTLSLFVTLFSAFASAQDFPNVQVLEISQIDSNMNGRVVVFPPDIEKRGRQIYAFEKDRRSQTIRIRATEVEELLIEYRLESRVTPGRFVRVRQEFDLGKADASTSYVELEPRQSQVLIDGIRDLVINCDSHFKVSLSAGRLNININDFSHLLSCKGKIAGEDFRELNPERLNDRNPKTQQQPALQLDKKALDKISAGSVEALLTAEKSRLFDSKSPVVRYLQEKMDLLVSVSDMPQLKPRVHVINRPIANAFVFPNGQTFVYRGLIDMAPSEDAVIGVLGHELAHVVREHSLKSTRFSWGMNALLVGGAIGAAVLAAKFKFHAENIVIASLASTLTIPAIIGFYSLSKSRVSESEADRYGAQYAWAAGYDPRGIGEFFAELQKKRDKNGQVSNPNLVEMMRTHPLSADRVIQANDMVDFFFPETEQLRKRPTEEFLKMKKYLSKNPLPKSKKK